MACDAAAGNIVRPQLTYLIVKRVLGRASQIFHQFLTQKINEIGTVEIWTGLAFREPEMFLKNALKSRAPIAVTFTTCFFCFLISAKCSLAQENDVRQPKYTVGKQTTHFTEPIHAGGAIDFAAAINQRLRQGVNSDNNACIPLYEAIGPHTAQLDLGDYLWGPKQVKSFFREIGAPERIYKMRTDLDDIRPTSIPQQHFRKYKHPDSRFEDVFRLLHDAARRDRYYSPLITNAYKGVRPQILAGSSYPSDVAIECAADLLLTRASAVSDSNSAWKDILASYRLGRLVAMGPEIDDAMLGIRIEQKSIAAAIEYLKRFQLVAADLKRCKLDLGKLPVRSTVVSKIDLAERYKCLDAVLILAHYGNPTTPNHGYPGNGRGLGEIYNELILHGMGDPGWDPALQEINQSYDQLVRILNLRNLNDRRQTLVEVKQTWKSMRGVFQPRERGEFSSVPHWERTPEYREHMETLVWLRQKLAKLTERIEASEKVDEETEAKALRIAGRAAAVMIQPAYVRAFEAEERTRQLANNLKIALALVEYHAANSNYPKRLDVLKPKYLKKIPQDVFADQLPAYRLLKNGCLLYSVGENQEDDDGVLDQMGSDDLGIKLDNRN